MIIARYDDGQFIGEFLTDSFGMVLLALIQDGYVSRCYDLNIIDNDHAVIEVLTCDILLERVI